MAAFSSSSSKVLTSMAQKAGAILVIGAGNGIGGHVAKRFAIQGGYHACLVRRSDQSKLNDTVHTIQQQGGRATGYLLDVTKPNTIETLIDTIEQEIGPIQICIYNLGAQIGNRTLDETTYKQFEMGWKLGTYGLFRLSKCLLPRMVQRRQNSNNPNGETTDTTTGLGTLIVTSATAAVRGNAGQHSHAAAMGGRRLLCQTINAEYAIQGIHVAHVLIDGPVDAPDTLGTMIGLDQLSQLRQQQRLLAKRIGI